MNVIFTEVKIWKFKLKNKNSTADSRRYVDWYPLWDMRRRMRVRDWCRCNKIKNTQSNNQNCFLWKIVFVLYSSVEQMNNFSSHHFIFTASFSEKLNIEKQIFILEMLSTACFNHKLNCKHTCRNNFQFIFELYWQYYCWFPFTHFLYENISIWKTSTKKCSIFSLSKNWNKILNIWNIRKWLRRKLI